MCFVISMEEASTLAQKIKKLQSELWDLEITYRQLQDSHDKTQQKLENIRSGGVNTTDILERIPPSIECDDDEEIEEEKKQQLSQLEIKYIELVYMLINLIEQAKSIPVGQNATILESFKKIIQTIEEKSTDTETPVKKKIKSKKSDDTGEVKRSSMKLQKITVTTSITITTKDHNNKIIKEKRSPSAAARTVSAGSRKKKVDLL